MNGYINLMNDEVSFIKFIFDKIIPNIDIILCNVKEDEKHIYTKIKNIIPELKSKEYYILNSWDFKIKRICGLNIINRDDTFLRKKYDF